jgi:8-oxo-dGTP diphosphatase
MENNKITGATCILIDPEGNILLQLRDNGNGKSIPFPNTWTFLGGAKEDGEDYASTAVREIKEECDINIEKNNLKLILVYDHDHAHGDHVFTYQFKTKPQIKVLEGADMKWFSLEEIKKIPLAFEQVKIIPYIKF